MRPSKHIDAVDLVKRKPVDRAAQMPLIGARRVGEAKALRGERDPPRLRQRERFDRKAGQGCSAR